MSNVVEVTRACGHTQSQDMGARKPYEVESFTRFLETKECRDCDTGYKKKRDAADRAARKKADEEVIAAEARAGLDPLTARSEKALAWGRRVRLELVAGAHELLVMGGTMGEEEFDALITVPASQISDASWWIDNRTLDPADLTERLASVLGDDQDAVVCENPA